MSSCMPLQCVVTFDFFCMQTLLVRPYSMVVRAAPLTEITVNPRRTWDELEP